MLEGGMNANNAQDGSGWSPLHLATSVGKTTVVRLLLSYGAQLNG